jgi:DNA (cytosine-5)-methyltransferase 1
VDTLEIVQPLYFILENVSNFLASGQFSALKRETSPRGRLAGYRIEPFVLNAAEYGVAQVRKRAVVIGSRKDLPAVGRPPAPLAGDRNAWVTVDRTIGDLDQAVTGIDLPATRMEFNGTLVPGPFKTVELHLGRRVSELSLRRYAAIPPGGNRNSLPDELKAPCWRRHTTGAGDVMGRLHAGRPSVTIRTEFWKPEKGRYLHPTADRPLTLHEGARLQGFDDDYLWCGSKADIGRQIGNAVPVGLAEAIACHLASHVMK